MILKLLLSLVSMIATGIINFVNGMFEQNALITDVNNFITSILTITTQAYNFMYFIFGNTLIIVVPITIGLLTTKYLVVPIIQIFRSFFINSNE